MTENYTIARQPKSIGISILLTFFLGPIGLFYSTIVGGLIMTLLPILKDVEFLLQLKKKNNADAFKT